MTAVIYVGTLGTKEILYLKSAVLNLFKIDGPMRRDVAGHALPGSSQEVEQPASASSATVTTQTKVGRAAGCEGPGRGERGWAGRSREVVVGGRGLGAAAAGA